MYAGSVAVGGHLVETVRKVHPGAAPFRGVDHPGLQRGHDLASGKIDRRGSEPCEHLRLQPGHPHAKTLQVLQTLQAFAEPADHLHAGIACDKCLQAVATVELVPQLLAAAVTDPRDLLERCQAAWNRAEERGAAVLGNPVVGRVVAHLGLALAHGVKHLERRHELSCREELDRKLAIRQLGNAISDALSSGADAWEILLPTSDHLPTTFTARIGRSADGGRRSGRAASKKRPSVER